MISGICLGWTCKTSLELQVGRLLLFGKVASSIQWALLLLQLLLHFLSILGWHLRYDILLSHYFIDRLHLILDAAQVFIHRFNLIHLHVRIHQSGILVALMGRQAGTLRWTRVAIVFQEVDVWDIVNFLRFDIGKLLVQEGLLSASFLKFLLLYLCLSRLNFFIFNVFVENIALWIRAMNYWFLKTYHSLSLVLSIVFSRRDIRVLNDHLWLLGISFIVNCVLIICQTADHKLSLTRIVILLLRVFVREVAPDLFGLQSGGSIPFFLRN